MSLDEFEKEYDSYEVDIKLNGGFRAWEKKDIVKDTDLSRSSGTIVYEREEER